MAGNVTGLLDMIDLIYRNINKRKLFSTNWLKKKDILHIQSLHKLTNYRNPKVSLTNDVFFLPMKASLYYFILFLYRNEIVIALYKDYKIISKI